MSELTPEGQAAFDELANSVTDGMREFEEKEVLKKLTAQLEHDMDLLYELHGSTAIAVMHDKFVQKGAREEPNLDKAIALDRQARRIPYGEPASIGLSRDQNGIRHYVNGVETALPPEWEDSPPDTYRFLDPLPVGEIWVLFVLPNGQACLRAMSYTPSTWAVGQRLFNRTEWWNPRNFGESLWVYVEDTVPLEEADAVVRAYFSSLGIS